MKVAIAGYGVEGTASYQYWLGLGAEVTIFDQKPNEDLEIPSGVDTQLGPDVFSQMQGYDIVIRTPGLNPRHITTDGKIWSATNEFFEKCPAQIIGVTGTKGKGTTCSLIAQILQAAGKTVHLLGNIGTPALEVLPSIKDDDIVVFELSSFQLWDIEKSPHIAVVLMVESDHMNVHEGMEDYVLAKANIVKFQISSDVLIHHPTNKNSLKIASLSKAQKQPYLVEPAAEIKESTLIIDGHTICDVSEIGLIGVHNQENVCAAVTAAWNVTNDVSAIKQGVTQFQGLPHRIENICTKDDVTFYDDSYSANPSATLAAIKCFKQPIVLILGGYDRKQSYDELAKRVVEFKNITHVVTVGQTELAVKQSLLNAGYEPAQIVSGGVDFDSVVKTAADLASSGDVVLLSPGSPSFDMFKNFEERGKIFKLIVEKL